MYLLFPGYCSKTELAKDLKLHPTTIDFHIRKLLDADIIKPIEVKNGRFLSHQASKPIVFKKPLGREVFYTWKNSMTLGEVYRILITHKESMMDSYIIDVYNDFKEEGYHVFDKFKPKKFCSFDSTVDNYIKILEEIFPFPYNY
jgi:DNA-binding transcriptional ArsR family regulator